MPEQEFNIQNDPSSLPKIERSTGEYDNKRSILTERDQIQGLDRALSHFKSRINTDDDPTFPGFKINFKINSTRSPLFNGAAEDFLNQYGRNVNSELLEKLKLALIEIQESRPWYFISFDGIDNLEQLPNDEFSRFSEDFFYQLSLNTWEDLDWRVQDLLEFYRRAVYDFASWKYILPENLRIFDLEIKIGETRRIRSEEEDYNETQPFKIYRFSHCQFLWGEDLLSSNLNNATPEQYLNALNIGLGPYTIYYQSSDGTVYTDEALEKSANLDGEDSLDRISAGNDERYMDLNGTKRDDQLSYPREDITRSQDADPFEFDIYGTQYGTTRITKPTRRSFFRRISGAAGDFLKKEIERSAEGLRLKIEREINRVDSAIRQEAQRAIAYVRNQANRRIQSLVPDVGDFIDDQRARNNPLDPVITGNQAATARRLREIEAELGKRVSELNVYERALLTIRNGELRIIGNVYD